MTKEESRGYIADNCTSLVKETKKRYHQYIHMYINTYEYLKITLIAYNS